MPEYTATTIVVLALTLVAAGRRGLLRRRSTWLAAAAFSVATIVADLVLTGLPVVTYDPAQLSGLMIGPMPIEDLGYGVALFFLAAIAWDAAAPRSRPR